MEDRMTFPATFDEFAEQYKIVDKQEVYTNGAELIPIFGVKQWLEDADVKTKSEWISVDERLPEASGVYLVHSYLGNHLILDYSARHKLFNCFDNHSTENAEGFAIGVTHWMPLPEAPKGKDGEGE